MAYITEYDLLNLFGDEPCMQGNDGVPATTRITAAIEVVEGEVNAYLRSGGYAVPFTGTGIKGRVADWVRYRLADDQGTVTDNIRDRYTEAVDFFRAISKGEISLSTPNSGSVGSVPLSRT